jgi:hypothetical protein
MALARYIRGETNPVIVPVATDMDCEVGDLVGLSSGTLVKASDTTWDTNLATTQTAFAALFLGVAGQRKIDDTARVVGNGQDNRVRVDAAGVWEYDCASANFTVGQLVGPAKATGDALEDQKVVGVATEALSIGVVAEAGTSVTRVKVKIHSQVFPEARQS